jgi:hypothetical protein
MRRNTLLIDVGIAVLVAIVVLIISPGFAVDAIIALAVIVACAVSFVVDARRGRSRRNARRRRRDQSRPARPQRPPRPPGRTR